MKFQLLFLIPLLALAGCETPTSSRPIPETEATTTFEAPFDKVWGIVVSDISNDYPLQVIEKQSGVLQTQMVSIGSGFGAETILRKYGSSPGILLATWSSARCSLSVFAKPVDDKHTFVRIRAHIEGLENNVTHSWQPWRSRAVLEQQFLNKVSASL